MGIVSKRCKPEHITAALCPLIFDFRESPHAHVTQSHNDSLSHLFTRLLIPTAFLALSRAHPRIRSGADGCRGALQTTPWTDRDAERSWCLPHKPRGFSADRS